jgi:hypothetical protein
MYPHSLIREMMNHSNRQNGIHDSGPNRQFQTVSCEQLKRVVSLRGTLKKVDAAVGAQEKKLRVLVHVFTVPATDVANKGSC